MILEVKNLSSAERRSCADRPTPLFLDSVVTKVQSFVENVIVFQPIHASYIENGSVHDSKGGQRS